MNLKKFSKNNYPITGNHDQVGKIDHVWSQKDQHQDIFTLKPTPFCDKIRLNYIIYGSILNFYPFFGRWLRWPTRRRAGLLSCRLRWKWRCTLFRIIFPAWICIIAEKWSAPSALTTAWSKSGWKSLNICSPFWKAVPKYLKNRS